MNEVLRQEKKFLITMQRLYQLRAQVLQVLALDAHSRGEGYLIRSLYFDTLDDQDFQEKEDGVELPQRSRMQFMNSSVRDENGITRVYGVAGPKGPEGPQGEVGPQGPAGPAVSAVCPGRPP